MVLPVLPGALGQVLVRAWEPGDADALNAAVGTSLEHLRPWMPWVHEPPMSAQQRAAWIVEQRAQIDSGGDAIYGIFRSGELAGGCGLHRSIGQGGLELGYWVQAGLIRQGIAVAATRILTDAAFALPDIDRVEIHHDKANIASGKVPAAAGYRLVAEVADGVEAPGEVGIECQWRLTRSEWAARARR